MNPHPPLISNRTLAQLKDFEMEDEDIEEISYILKSYPSKFPGLSKDGKTCGKIG